MSTPTLTIRDLARRLIALEVARDASAVAAPPVAVRVCERLRGPLARLAGVAGFRSLISRALALAKAEVHSLAQVQVRDDGSLEGFDEAGHDHASGTGGEAGVVVVAQLLGLLMTFIGAPLTMGLVRDAWPDVSLTGIDAGSGEGS